MRVGNEARIDRIFPPAFRRRTRDSDLFIEFLNGSRLQFVGSDNFDNLRGGSVKGVVFSEYATALPEAWPTLRPMIDQNNGIVIFISTPRGKNHFHDIYETAKASPHWFAERRGVNETDIYDNEQLGAALEELTKVYGKARVRHSLTPNMEQVLRPRFRVPSTPASSSTSRPKGVSVR
jgi:hypothetical protein